MKFSCVPFYDLAFVSCIFVSPSKKTSSRFLFCFFVFLFYIPCIQFLANLSVNSLQIFVRSYLPSELRWQNVVSMLNSDTPNCYFQSNWTISVPPKNTTRCYRFHTSEKTICHLHPAFLLQLHSMILVLYQHHTLYATLLCDSRTKPILTHSLEDPFLEIDVKGGREITSKLILLKGGGRKMEREREKKGERGNLIKGPRCLVFKRREDTCL